MSISDTIFTLVKEINADWKIQAYALCCLLLNSILIPFASFRKRTGNELVIFLIWLGYLVADWLATFTVGLISCDQKIYNLLKDEYDLENTGESPADILALWATFLLLHRRPEQDNDSLSWQRHLVGLLNKIFTAIIIFGHVRRSKVWIPTVIMFVAGTIRYGDRLFALFLGKLLGLFESIFKKPIPWPNFWTRLFETVLPTEGYAVLDKGIVLLDDAAAVKEAYSFFNIFGGLILDLDLILTPEERETSRQFFSQRDPEDAFQVLAVELNFIYQVLNTKVVVLVYSSREKKVAVVHSMLVYFIRFISWCAVLTALLTFHSSHKQGLLIVDIVITYILFGGLLGSEIIAAIFTLAFSDLTAAFILKLPESNIISRCFLPLLRRFLRLKRINWPGESISCLKRARRILFRRWSESLRQYNLIDYCLNDRQKMNTTLVCVMEEMDLKVAYDRFKYVSKKPLTNMLWAFIYEELKKKSDDHPAAGTEKKIPSGWGGWDILKNNEWNISESSELGPYLVHFEYDRSLILWHVATELCYQMKSDTENNIRHETHEDTTNHREFCKTLSDYMIYLLVMKPTMMSAVSGIGHKIFRDTCTQAKQKVFHKHEKLKDACTRILKENTSVENVAKDGSKSVFFDARILAKELGQLDEQKRWSLMSKVWCKLLFHAASRCRARACAAQLSKGGEFITFVWLLMAHLGIEV